MSWSMLVPSSLAALGSVLLGLALVLVLLDMPGGVPWAKIGAWCAVLGGFGALGNAGGWIGDHIVSGSESAMSWGAYYGARLIGNGIVLVLIALAVLWAYKHLFGKGIEAGGKGTGSKKVRKLFKATVFALVGATVAIVIPWLYSGLDSLVSGLHGLIA